MQHNSDFYREEAAKYRELAEMAKDAATKQELSELAAACEGIADQIDDLRSSGSNHARNARGVFPCLLSRKI
jgi:hypothetical protein